MQVAKGHCTNVWGWVEQPKYEDDDDGDDDADIFKLLTVHWTVSSDDLYTYTRRIEWTTEPTNQVGPGLFNIHTYVNEKVVALQQ